jgi:hypothetical protein
MSRVVSWQSGAEVLRSNTRRDGAFDTPALLRFFPCVGEDAHGTAEHEQTSGQRRGETKFGIDDGGCAVNIYGYRRKRGLNGSGRGEMVAGHDTIASGIVHKRQKGCRPRINSMEAVPETGNVGGLRPPFGENFACRRLEIAAAVMEMVADFGEQLDALLSGAAVGVSEHVDTGGDGAVEADAACGRHAGGGNRRCVRPVVNGGNQCRLKEGCLAGLGWRSSQHEPDDVDETGFADQLLDGNAAQLDDAGLNAGHGGRPPVLNLRHDANSLYVHGCADSALCSPRRGGGEVGCSGSPSKSTPLLPITKIARVAVAATSPAAS